MPTETPIINFPVKGVDLEVDAAALESLLCSCPQVRNRELYTSLESVTIQGPAAYQNNSKPVYHTSIPMSELEGRIIQIAFNFTMEGELSSKPTYLWLNRGLEANAFMSWWPSAAQISGFLTAFFKVKDGVFTTLHNNSVSMPWGLSSAISPAEKTITTENVDFQLASSPLEDTGAVTYHHFMIRAI